MFAALLCPAAPSIATSKRFPLHILALLCKQALGLNGREALIPEGDRNANMLFKTFGESLHASTLSVNQPIQANGYTNDKTLCLCLANKALDCLPCLCLVTRNA